jgi:excinuclease UvrABC ATPase subunit
VEVRHGAGTTKKKFEGVIRRLERYYANKADDEADEGEKDAYDRFLRYGPCPACGGTRLNPRALSVRVGGKTIAEASALELASFDAFLADLEIPGADGLIRKMRSVAGRLIEMSAGYLSLDRTVSTLSGGESQRVKLARRLDCDLSGLVYVLDEPSAGLHPADARKLVGAMRSLSEAGNAVLVVEHDPALISEADWAIEIGPAAGRSGGELLYSGPVEGLARTDGPTARVLRERADRLSADGRPGGEGRRNRSSWTESFPVRGGRREQPEGRDRGHPQGHSGRHLRTRRLRKIVADP